MGGVLGKRARIVPATTDIDGGLAPACPEAESAKVVAAIQASSVRDDAGSRGRASNTVRDDAGSRGRANNTVRDDPGSRGRANNTARGVSVGGCDGSCGRTSNSVRGSDGSRGRTSNVDNGSDGRRGTASNSVRGNLVVDKPGIEKTDVLASDLGIEKTVVLASDLGDKAGVLASDLVHCSTGSSARSPVMRQGQGLLCRKAFAYANEVMNQIDGLSVSVKSMEIPDIKISKSDIIASYVEDRMKLSKLEKSKAIMVSASSHPYLYAPLVKGCNPGKGFELVLYRGFMSIPTCSRTGIKDVDKMNEILFDLYEYVDGLFKIDKASDLLVKWGYLSEADLKKDRLNAINLLRSTARSVRMRILELGVLPLLEPKEMWRMQA